MIAGGVIALLALIFARPWEKAPSPPPTPTESAKPAVAPVSEARQLVAKAWVLLNKPEMARAELDAADALCKRAAALDPTDAEVWAAWSHVNVWYCFHNLDASPQRQEAAREYAARAMQLDPKSFEARLAQAFYWVRGDAKSQRVVEAQRLLRVLLQEKPDEPRALFTLGFSVNWSPGGTAEGMGLLERLAGNPGFAAVAWDEIGWNCYFKGDQAKAEAAVAQSLAVQPYWNNLGLKITLAERVHGDMDLAEATLKQMPASALQEDWGIGFACEVYQWRREPLRTIELLEGLSRDWIHYYFNNYPKTYLLGEARLMAKQAGAARRDFQRALVLIEKQLTDDPNNGYLLGLQARTLLYLGEKEEAEKSYRLVKELGGTDYLQIHFAPPDAAIAFIRSMAETPYVSEARTYFSAASLRLDPQFDRLRTEPAFQALLAQLAAGNKPAAPATVAPAVDQKSVAVLAFANLSDDKNNEYFSDGISEELLNVLAKVPGLKVTARTSSFHFKGKDTAIKEIGQQLGVAYVIEGSVRKQGDKVRITAQLIKAVDGFHVWSDTFTRDLRDIFAVQDEIAGLIAKNLELKLGASGTTTAVDPQAFELYVQARQAWNQRNEAGFARAAELLDRALELAPDFARAHAARADVWVLQRLNRGPMGGGAQRDSPEAQRIFAEIQRALALEPESAEAHASLGNSYLNTWRQADAIREFRRAIGLNPNYASAHHWLGRALWIDGWIDEAGAELRRAAELDPLSHRILDNNAAYEYAVGHYAAALALNERALALQPDAIQAATFMARDLSALGRHNEAVALIRRWGIDRQKGYELFAVEAFVQAGLKPEAEEIFARLPEDELYWGHLLLGRREQALAALSSAELGLGDGSEILLAPLFDPIRDDPRFRQKLAAIGMTEAHARAQAWRAAHPPEKPEAKK